MLIRVPRKFNGLIASLARELPKNGHFPGILWLEANRRKRECARTSSQSNLIFVFTTKHPHSLSSLLSLSLSILKSPLSPSLPLSYPFDLSVYVLRSLLVCRSPHSSCVFINTTQLPLSSSTFKCLSPNSVSVANVRCVLMC